MAKELVKSVSKELVKQLISLTTESWFTSLLARCVVRIIFNWSLAALMN